jgi:hypothetical protein
LVCTQDDGEGYDEEQEGMDEDELLDEEDLVDGASEGSDDAARMGIQSMQVRGAAHTAWLSRQAASAACEGLWLSVCFIPPAACVRLHACAGALFRLNCRLFVA